MATFLRGRHWNHRARLTALLTVTVSISLALVFLAVALVVRQEAVNRRFTELQSAVTRISQSLGAGETLRDAQDDYPNVDVGVFQVDGTLVRSTSRRPPPSIEGRSMHSASITYGLRRGQTLVVGRTSLAETEAGLQQLEWVLACLWLPLTLLTAMVAWYGGGLVLRPVSELIQSAKRLSETAGGPVLATTDKAEFALLADTLNQLIERVRRSAAVQEQFASDAAHELRTPLSLLRTRIETNLIRARTPDEHVAAQESMLCQIDRFTEILETLLLSARSPGPTQESQDLESAVHEAVAGWSSLREWPDSRLVLETEPCRAFIRSAEVEIILRNLLDNGARHTPDEAAIEVRLSRCDGQVRLTVRDHGHGLSAAEMEMAFERFYRADEGRGRTEGGAGIGLAIVRRIVESAGGSVAFVPVECGAMVRVSLPDMEL